MCTVPDEVVRVAFAFVFEMKAEFSEMVGFDDRARAVHTHVYDVFRVLGKGPLVVDLIQRQERTRSDVGKGVVCDLQKNRKNARVYARSLFCLGG